MASVDCTANTGAFRYTPLETILEAKSAYKWMYSQAFAILFLVNRKCQPNNYLPQNTCNLFGWLSFLLFRALTLYGLTYVIKEDVFCPPPVTLQT